MAAQDNLNPNQMRLFMQAKELMDTMSGHVATGSDKYAPMSQAPGLYKSKLHESKEGSAASTLFSKKRGKDSLYQSIQKEGVRTPIRLRMHQGTEQINDGHHRVAAANDINPEMYLPVSYDS
jgi:hypothetical protein